MTFQKGQSGNPKGRPPGKKALTTSLRSRVEKTGERQKLEQALFDLAYGHQVRETDSKGRERIYTTSPDFRAIQYIYDRIDGKPLQAVEHSGEDGQPIEFSITVRTDGDSD